MDELVKRQRGGRRVGVDGERGKLEGEGQCEGGTKP